MHKNIFCDECGNILDVKLVDRKKFGFCSCGFVKEVSSEVISDEKEPERVKIGEGIINENSSEKLSGFPHTCKKCGCEESEVYDLGASYSDESNKYLFKCKKCGFVERQADGSGNH